MMRTHAVAARLDTVVGQSVLGLTSQAIAWRCFAAHDLWVILRLPDLPTGCTQKRNLGDDCR